jgi:hypothetical protein
LTLNGGQVLAIGVRFRVFPSWQVLEMEEKHDKSSNSVTDIAADGDVILVVGPERRKLRVHSLILKNVSTAFNAMFGPHFKEVKASVEPARKRFHCQKTAQTPWNSSVVLSTAATTQYPTPPYQAEFFRLLLQQTSTTAPLASNLQAKAG